MRSKPHRPGVSVTDITGAKHVGLNIRFEPERAGILRRRTVECAYLCNACGDWVRIGPIREMSFT